MKRTLCCRSSSCYLYVVVSLTWSRLGMAALIASSRGCIIWQPIKFRFSIVIVHVYQCVFQCSLFLRLPAYSLRGHFKMGIYLLLFFCWWDFGFWRDFFAVHFFEGNWEIFLGRKFFRRSWTHLMSTYIKNVLDCCCFCPHYDYKQTADMRDLTDCLFTLFRLRSKSLKSRGSYGSFCCAYTCGGCWSCSPTCSWWCWRSGRLLRDRNIRVITFVVVVVVVVARPKKLLQNLRTLIGGSSYDLNFFFCQKDCGGGGKISSSKMDDNDDIL